jgi:hypothetical protein
MIWYKIYENNTIDFSTDNTLVNILDAAKITVDHIIKNYPPPYNIMVSGGIDSQAMLYSWKLFGKDYIPTAVMYNDYLNEHDLVTLDTFSQEQNISIEYLKFDLLKFYETEYDTLCEKYKCRSPHFGAHLGMTENLQGTCIFSGDCLGKNGANIRSNNICMYEATKYRSIVPYFFMHTPEIAYSKVFVASKYKRKKLDYADFQQLYQEKAILLINEGFPIIPQQEKYTGFEKVKDLYDEKYRHLITPKILLKYANKPSKRTYDLLLRYPYEDKYGTPNFRYIIDDIHRR